MRQICAAVQMIFIAASLSAIGSVISNIEALAGLGSLMTIAGGVLMIVTLYRLKHENRHFSNSIRAFWIYMGMAVVLVFALTWMIVGMLEGGEPNIGILTLVLLGAASVAVLVAALVMQHQLYKGFDRLREVRELDYPAGRIMWCFYLALISMLITLVSTIGMGVLTVNGIMGGDAALQAALVTLGTVSDVLLVVGVLIEAVHLWLLFTFMQSTKAALENDMTDSWG